MEKVPHFDKILIYHCEEEESVVILGVSGLDVIILGSGNSIDTLDKVKHATV